MGSTFASVYVSYRAMVAAQASTSTVGNNISNMNTDGYTRQRTELESQTLSGYRSRFDTNFISTGDGVAANRTIQIRDTFLDARFRSEHADTGRYESISDALKDVENIIDEISTKGVQAQFDDFVNQLQNLSQYPTSKDMGLVVRTSAQQIAQMLNIYSGQLDQVRAQQVYDLSTVTIDKDFNTIVENIADLNGEIRQEYLYGNNPNELMDKRNSLIDELSKMANIQVVTTADEVAPDLFLEHVTISLYDEATSSQIGLVDHTHANTLTLNDDGDKVSLSMNTSFKLKATPKTVDYDDVTKYFQTGSISGYIDMINGEGDYADVRKEENDFRGIPYYRNMLDTFASNFAEKFNELNSIQTKNKDAFPVLQSNVAKESGYEPQFMQDYLAVFKDFSFQDNADQEVAMNTINNAADLAASGVAKISISADKKDAIAFVEKNFPGAFTKDADGNVTITDAAALAKLTPTKLTDPADVEAAAEAFPVVERDAAGNVAKMQLQRKDLFAPADDSEVVTAGNIYVSKEWIDNPLHITTTKDPDMANGISELSGGVDNVVRMISAVAQELDFHAKAGDTASELKFTGTFNEYMVATGATLALDVEMNNTYLKTSNTLLSSIDKSRESISGVNLDEEATNLMTFQSAYNAAARYFTALDEMMDKLINGTGIVGR